MVLSNTQSSKAIHLPIKENMALQHQSTWEIHCKMKFCNLLLVLFLFQCHYYCYGGQVNIVPGMYSRTTVSNGLYLPATATFKPISALTMKLHIVDKFHATFIHYQITFETANADFRTKLLINYANAGSLVHSGKKQTYKTATRFYMANGYYTIEVQYKSPEAINMAADWDWQTAIK